MSEEVEHGFYPGQQVSTNAYGVATYYSEAINDKARREMRRGIVIEVDRWSVCVLSTDDMELWFFPEALSPDPYIIEELTL